MKVCDICGRSGVKYETSAIINEVEISRPLELCGICYDKFHHKEKHYRYLAYAEVVEEITGKSAKRPSLMERLKSVIGW